MCEKEPMSKSELWRASESLENSCSRSFYHFQEGLIPWKQNMKKWVLARVCTVLLSFSCQMFRVGSPRTKCFASLIDCQSSVALPWPFGCGLLLLWLQKRWHFTDDTLHWRSRSSVRKGVHKSVCMWSLRPVGTERWWCFRVALAPR